MDLEQGGGFAAHFDEASELPKLVERVERDGAHTLAGAALECGHNQTYPYEEHRKVPWRKDDKHG